MEISAIIGLGNPGPAYAFTRHNIGFLVVDALAQHHHAPWHQKDLLAYAEINLQGKNVLLIKPLTFMNSSGKVLHWLAKKGIKPEHILVVHDELELPFGKLKFRPAGGSAKGHNGLRSLIEIGGTTAIPRLSVGIDRPAQKEMVGTYVLQKFSQPKQEVEQVIEQAVKNIEEICK